MAKNGKGLGTEIPVSASVGAEVRRGGTVTMYRDGIPVQVPANEAAHFQGLGFLRESADDLPALEAEITALMGQLPPLLQRFVKGVTADGVIDPQEEADLHVLTRTWNTLNEKLQRLLNVAYQVYPIKEVATDE